MIWTVQDSKPSGGKIFCTCPNQPWSPPSLMYNGYQVSSTRAEAGGAWG